MKVLPELGRKTINRIEFDSIYTRNVAYRQHFFFSLAVHGVVKPGTLLAILGAR